MTGECQFNVERSAERSPIASGLRHDGPGDKTPNNDVSIDDGVHDDESARPDVRWRTGQKAINLLMIAASVHAQQEASMSINPQPRPVPKSKWTLGKILLTLGLGFVVMIGAIIGVVFWAASGVSSLASDFFEHLRKGETDRAYALTSPQFQRAANRQQFARFVENRRMNKVQSASWPSRKIDGSAATLTGTLTDADGGAQQASIRFSKVSGNWRIHYLDIKLAGIEQGAQADAERTGIEPVSAANVQIPPEGELIRLIQDSNAVFARSIATGDMSLLRDHAAAAFRRRHDVEKLNEAFGGFLKNKPDLATLANHRPVFSKPPALDKDNWLEIEGYYDTKPVRVTFEHTYIREGPGWKLIGYSLNLRRAPGEPAPAQK